MQVAKQNVKKTLLCKRTKTKFIFVEYTQTDDVYVRVSNGKLSEVYGQGANLRLHTAVAYPTKDEVRSSGTRDVKWDEKF